MRPSTIKRNLPKILILFGLIFAVSYFFSTSDRLIKDFPPTPAPVKHTFDTCPSFNYTFDDPTILRQLGKRKPFNCTPIELLTILTDGQLLINPKFPGYQDYDCRARCAHFYKNYENKFGNWCYFVHDQCLFECDVIDVECKKNGSIDYLFAHTQIYEYSRDRRKDFGDLYRETLAPKISKDHFHPNVHILLLDAMGLNPTLRQLPKTISFLRDNFESVMLEKYTRTGDNSRLNMLSGFFGEIPVEVDRRLYGGGVSEATLPKNTCELPLDDRNYIQFEYEDAGYKTMYAQDNFLVTFGYLECVGIKNQLATHYMRPYQLIEMIRDDVWTLQSANLFTFCISDSSRPIKNRSFANDHLLKRFLRNESNCEQLHTHALDYTTKFLKSYPGIPKMSITWMSFAHDDELPAHRTDNDFHRFLREHQDYVCLINIGDKNLLLQLDDSIFILMADHGQKFSAIAASKQGQFETNNPTMFFSLPKRLRGSKLHETVKNNSKALFSHHDLYATLTDIIRYQPSSDFSDTKFRPIERSFGNSWLRELDPNLPRSCRSLPISSQYCTCDYGMKSIPKSDKIWKRLNVTLGKDMNDHLEKAGIGDKCKKIKTSEISEVHQISTMNQTVVYNVLFHTNTGGVFVVQYDLTKEDKMIPSPADWKRVNSYGNAADCLHSRYAEYKPMCYCKKLP